MREILLRAQVPSAVVSTLLLACGADSVEESFADRALESGGLDSCYVTSEHAADEPRYDSLRSFFSNRSGPIMAEGPKGTTPEVELTLEWQPETFVVLVTAPKRGPSADCPELPAIEVRVRLRGERVEVDTTLVVVPSVQGATFVGRGDAGDGRRLWITIDGSQTHGSLSGPPVRVQNLYVYPELISW